MTKYNIDDFIMALKAKEADASRILQSRESIIVEKSADEFDQIERAATRDIAVQNLDQESKLLREIRSALRRVDEGAFGTCLHCEGDQPAAPGGGALGTILPAMSGGRRPRR